MVIVEGNTVIYLKFAFASCLLLVAGILHAQSPGRLDALLDRLAAQNNPALTTGGAQPSWVRNPSSAFPGNTHFAAVGHGSTRAGAERMAFGELAAFFGQHVQADFSSIESYSRALSQGIVTVSSREDIRSSIITAASMDSLIGAQIGGVWDNGRGSVYALAFIERQKAAAIYTEMIHVNEAAIASLVSIPNYSRNTFDGFARFMLAANIAEINTTFANVVALSTGSAYSLRNITSPHSLRLQAAEIIRNIGVAVIVEGDQNNRLRNAFTHALNEVNLRTRGTNPLYTLEVSMSMREVVFPDTNHISMRFTLSAELVNNATNSVLFPFSFTDRAFHPTHNGAENNAFRLAEREIHNRFPAEFRQWLNSILPIQTRFRLSKETWELILFRNLMPFWA